MNFKMNWVIFAALLWVATLVQAPPANAGFWDCICNLFSSGCGAQVLPPGVHPRAYENLNLLQIGARVELTRGSKKIVGRVVEANFESIAIEVEVAGLQSEPKRETFAHKKIEAITVLEPAPTESASDPVRLRLSRYKLEARKKYLEFLNTDFISPQKEALTAEITRLRAMPDRATRETYLKAEADAILARIEERLGTSNIGFHFNLNGGVGRDYIDGGGLKISRGDVALQYGSGDLAEKVYLFQSRHANLYDVLDSTNPKLIAGGRMGSELNIFNLDHEYFAVAVREGGILKENSISFDFNPDWLAGREINTGRATPIGIPYMTYLAPPIQVFRGFRGLSELGRLSRMEETLITMRQIEAILLAPDRHLPRETIHY